MRRRDQKKSTPKRRDRVELADVRDIRGCAAFRIYHIGGHEMIAPQRPTLLADVLRSGRASPNSVSRFRLIQPEPIKV